MYCTQRAWCDLVIRTKDLHIHRENLLPGRILAKGSATEVKGILFHNHIARAVIAFRCYGNT